MNVLFWINKRRTNARGEAPLMLRVTHHGKRVNVTTDVRLKPDLWDSKKQRAKGTSTLAQETNNLINTQRSACIHSVEELLKVGKPYSVNDICDAIKGEVKPEIGLVEMYEKHIADMVARIGLDFARGTVKRYKSSKKHMQLFIKQTYKQQDMNLSRVDRIFIAELDQFLRGNLKLSNNYVIKTIEQTKKVFKKGVLLGYVQHNPFDLISYKKSETFKDYLYADELKKLIAWQTDNQRLEITKDIFLFTCYTGLAHCDAKKALFTDISIDAQDRPWLILRRTKNNNLVQVPLLNIAISIIKKYENSNARIKKGVIIDVPCNQVLNRNLKDLAEAVGINKHLCTHSGRYTFASTVLLGNGVRVEVAQKLLAHNSIKSTMIYAKLSQQSIITDIRSLEEKL